MEKINQSPEISCRNCEAACCQGGTIMELAPDEHQFMVRAGNELITLASPEHFPQKNVVYPAGLEVDEQKGTVKILVAEGNETEPLAAGMGRYILFSACKYLETSEDGWQCCGVYEQRPKVCRDFEESSDKCKIMRMRAGVDEPTPEFTSLIEMLGDR